MRGNQLDVMKYAMRECVTPPVLPVQSFVEYCMTCNRYMVVGGDLIRTRKCRHCTHAARQELLSRQSITPGGMSCSQSYEETLPQQPARRCVIRLGRSDPSASSAFRYHGSHSDDT